MSLRRATILFTAVALAGLFICGCGSREKDKAKESSSESAKRASAKKKPGDNGPTDVQPGGFDVSQYLDPFHLGSGSATSGPSAPGTAPPTAGAPTPAVTQAGKPPALPARPTPEQLLNAVQALYGSAKSVKMAYTSTATFKEDGKVTGRESAKVSILFKRPNKFVFEGPDMEVYGDGKNVTMYMPSQKRYAKSPMDERALQILIGSNVSAGGMLLGIDYAPFASSMTLLKDNKFKGKDVFVLQIKLKEGGMIPPGTQTVQTLWIDKADLSIVKNQQTMKMKPKAPPGYKGKVPKSVETSAVGTLIEFARNPNLPDSAFRFSPPAGATVAEKPKEVSLLDKHAPELSFKWTDGAKKKLSDFRGKVVVLNFWFMPGSEEQIPALQKVLAKQDDKIHLISINLNDKPDTVVEFLKKKDYTLPVVYADAALGESIARSYGIRALPTTLIIDAEGIVQREILGIPKEDDLNAKIEKFL